MLQLKKIDNFLVNMNETKQTYNEFNKILCDKNVKKFAYVDN